MLLLRLRLVNFRQHELTDLELGEGMLGIVGPNGAGKSTLLEAIAYALYGVTGTRGTRDTLRRRGAPPRARFEVVLEFALGPHRYRISRTLTSAELLQDGQVIANSTGAVTERVTALLGMSRDEFFNTYFTGQKELAVMAAMGRVERAQFLSRVLGHERLRHTQERIREERAAGRAELSGIEQGLGDPEAIESERSQASRALEEARVARDQAATAEREATAAVGALVPEWEAAQQRRAAWQALDGERRVAEARVVAARERFAALDRDLAGAVAARERLTTTTAQLSEWSTLMVERDALERAAAAVTARSQSVARRDQLRQRVVEIEARRTQLPDADRVQALDAARAAANRTREGTEQRLAERSRRWTQDAQDAETRLLAFRERYRELKEQRDLLERQGPDGKCPTCGRPLQADHGRLLELLDRQMEEVQIDGQYLRQRTDQLRTPPVEIRELEAELQRHDAALRSATEALGEAQAGVRLRAEVEDELQRLRVELEEVERALAGPAASYDPSRHQAVRTRLAELEPVRREHDQLVGLAGRAEALIGEAAQAEQVAAAAETDLATLDARLTGLDWNPDRFRALEQRVMLTDARQQEARVSVARAVAAVEGAERLLAAATARQDDRRAKVESARRLARRLGMLDELDRGFTDLRTELNQQLRPELADRASSLLHSLTGGRYGDLELDEAYLPTIVEDGEAKTVISGGEEDVVNLALRLAISQLIAERAGQPLSLLVLDEIFGSLDEERRGSVLELLRGLADRFPQVILITHVEGMRDAFDRVLRLEYNVQRRVTTAHEEAPAESDAAA